MSPFDPPPEPGASPHAAAEPPLTHVADTHAGEWLAGDSTPWPDVVTDGPAGFEAHVRIPLPAPEQGTESERIGAVYRHLAPHTRTTETCWFALWDGWGDIEGGTVPNADLLRATGDVSFFGRFFFPDRPPKVPPAFDDAVLEGPRLSIGERDYLLFRGPLTAAGRWGAKPIATEWPRREISIPNLAWPEDRAWLVAADPFAEFIGVACSKRAAADLLADSALGATAHDAGGR